MRRPEEEDATEENEDTDEYPEEYIDAVSDRFEVVRARLFWSSGTAVAGVTGVTGA